MTDSIEFSISGLDDIQKKLEELGKKQAKKIITKATRTGMKETRKKAVRNAKRIDNPRTEGKIYKNIAIKVNARNFNRDGSITARVGIKGGSKKYTNNKRNRRKGLVGQDYEHGGDFYYWRFLEFGTSHAQAKPFMRPAMDNDQITNAVRDSLSASIEQIIKGS